MNNLYVFDMYWWFSIWYGIIIKMKSLLLATGLFPLSEEEPDPTSSPHQFWGWLSTMSSWCKTRCSSLTTAQTTKCLISMSWFKNNWADRISFVNLTLLFHTCYYCWLLRTLPWTADLSRINPTSHLMTHLCHQVRWHRWDGTSPPHHPASMLDGWMNGR